MEVTLNKAAITEWVAALRSGEFEQGQGYLQSQDGEYCCLGVLCELAARQGIVEREQPDQSYPVRYGGQKYFLPESVLTWAGLPDNSPMDKTDVVLHDAEGDCVMATSLNDSGEYSFNEIADLIEKEFLSDGR